MEFALWSAMKFWSTCATSSRAPRLRHNFIVGPQRHIDLFGRAARLYYCVRCKWSFLVRKNTVVVLDENESPIAGEESLRRFNTFGEGPCLVLAAFVAAALAHADAAAAPSRSRHDEFVNAAPSHIPARSRPRPLLRVLTRAR